MGGGGNSFRQLLSAPSSCRENPLKTENKTITTPPMAWTLLAYGYVLSGVLVHWTHALDIELSASSVLVVVAIAGIAIASVVSTAVVMVGTQAAADALRPLSERILSQLDLSVHTGSRREAMTKTKGTTDGHGFVARRAPPSSFTEALAESLPLILLLAIVVAVGAALVLAKRCAPKEDEDSVTCGE